MADVNRHGQIDGNKLKGKISMKYDLIHDIRTKKKTQSSKRILCLLRLRSYTFSYRKKRQRN